MNWPDWKLVLTIGLLAFVGYGVTNIPDLVLLISAACK